MGRARTLGALERVRSLLIAAAAVLAAGWGAPATAGDAGDRLQAFLDGITTLEASFTQVVVDEQFRTTERSAGKVFLWRPGRFRWEYTDPPGQTIVGDGERVWVHDPELDQVTVRPMSEALGGSPAALLISKRRIDTEFEVAAPETSGGIEWTELTPRHADAGFAKIRVGIYQGELAAMELLDGFGQLTQLRFSDVRRNEPLDPKLFVFVPPSGADVIGDR